MTNDSGKARKRARDLPQRTVSGLFLHVLWCATSIFLVISLTVGLIGGVAGKILLGRTSEYLAGVEKEATFSLEGQHLNETSFIYAYDKQLGDYVELRQINATENRVWADYEEIPEAIIQAAVAIEDKRFWEHEGVDWMRTISAAGMMFLGGGSVYGGSTITQQLIKNITQEDQVTVRRKLTEIFRALNFEKNSSKEEILCWYLNTIYLGEGAYGVKSAAKVYFAKDLNELTVKECACLVGITNNPSRFDPYIFPKNNEERTRTILQQMYEQGYIKTQEEYDRISDQELVFQNGTGKKETYLCQSCGFEGTIKKYTAVEDENGEEVEGAYLCPSCGTEQHFDVEKGDYYSYFEDQVVRDVIADLMEAKGITETAASRELQTGGYIIYSTIDLDAQAIVDQIYEDPSNVAATYSSQQLQSAIILIDNSTGDIIAMSGGIGEKEGSLTWNRATQSHLSPGSSIKPLTVYGPAIEYGIITPGSAYEDSAYEPYSKMIGSNWPQNDSRTYAGWMLVNTGVVRSLNTIAVKVLADLTPEKSYEFATTQLGLTSLVASEEINGREFTDISLAPLGMGQLTNGLTVREVASAYASFPNQGIYRRARTYTKVVDSKGNVVLENSQDEHRAFSEHTAWYITYMLHNAVLGGTATLAQMPNTPVAGKTGTSSGDKDRWFAGYTPYYTAVVWCGYDDPETIRLVVSGSPAVKLWKAVMTKMMEGLPYQDFPMPTDEAFVSVSVCSETGLLAGKDCTPATIRLFASDVPKKTCTNHKGFEVELCYPDASNKDYRCVANDYCRQYYELTHSEQFKLLTESGALDFSGYTLNNVVKETIKVLIPDSEETDHTATLEDALEQEELKECKVHTQKTIDALRAMLAAAQEIYDAQHAPPPVIEVIPSEAPSEAPTEAPTEAPVDTP